MDPTQGAIYELTRTLFNIALGSDVGKFGSSFLVLVVALRFIAWQKKSVNGERADQIAEDFHQLRSGGEIRRKSSPARVTKYRR